MSDATIDPAHPSDLGFSDEEARAGQPIFDEDLVALWTLDPLLPETPADDVIWNITNQRQRTIPDKVCIPAGALVIAGVGITNPEGAITLSVNDFYCPPEGNINYKLQEPIILTATASGSQPVYITTEVVWGDRNSNELTLIFFSWGIAGRPVPNAVFRWHLTIAASLFPG